MASDPTLHPPCSPVAAPAAAVSARQRGLWRVACFLASTPLLNHTIAFHLTGKLSMEALAEAVHRLSERQQLLRTVFVADGDALGSVLGSCPQLRIFDLRERPHAEAQAILAQELATPFELTGEPLFRITLIRLSQAANVLISTLHALIWDRRSTEILLAELARLYRAARDRVPAALPQLPSQYRDLAAEEETPGMRARREADVSYWRRQLAALPPAPLPSDLGTATSDPSPTCREALSLDLATRLGLDRFCRNERSTRFIAAAAALLALLHRSSGLDDLRIATAVENRRTRVAEQLIGPFSQGFILRARLSPGMRFGALADAIHRTFLEGLGHQSLSFDELVEALEMDGTRRDHLANTSLFMEPGTPSLELPGIQARMLSLEPPGTVESAGSDLDLRILFEGDELRCELAYNASCFSAGRALALLREFVALLNAGTAAPEATLSSLYRGLGGGA